MGSRAAELPNARRIRGPEGPWQQVRADLAETGTALVHCGLADWSYACDDEHLMGALLGAEAARWTRMPPGDVRRRFAVSRLLLKHALGAVIGAPAAGIELAKRPAGSPYAQGCDHVEVSLSHTDAIVLVGLTTLGFIGVDVERADRDMLESGLQWEVCTPAELAELHSLPPEQRNAALVRLWTLKEAYSKAVGQGLRFSFREFGFSTPVAAPQLCAPDGESADCDAWSFRTGAISDGYTAAVAVLDVGRGVEPAKGSVPLLDHEVAALLSALLTGADTAHVCTAPQHTSTRPPPV